MHYAVGNPRNIPVLEKLYSIGAKIDAVDNAGLTPLLFAALSGALECIDWLISKFTKLFSSKPKNVITHEKTRLLLEQKNM